MQNTRMSALGLHGITVEEEYGGAGWEPPPPPAAVWTDTRSDIASHIRWR